MRCCVRKKRRERDERKTRRKKGIPFHIDCICLFTVRVDGR